MNSHYSSSNLFDEQDFPSNWFSSSCYMLNDIDNDSIVFQSFEENSNEHIPKYDNNSSSVASDSESCNIDSIDSIEQEANPIWDEYDLDNPSLSANSLLQLTIGNNGQKVDVEGSSDDSKTSTLKLDDNEINFTSAASDSYQSKDLLKESITCEAKVKMCLNRKDVVIKSILRSMRQYYADLLQDNTNYRRKMRNIKLKHKLLISCSKEVADSIALSDFQKSLPFYLASVAFPIDVKKIMKKSAKSNSKHRSLFNQGVDIINNIETALSKFSKKVLEDFVKMPEICILLLNYLSKVDNQEYQEHYKMLKVMASDSISEYNNSQCDGELRVEEKLFDLCK